MISREDAKSLAVCYRAFTATDFNDSHEISIWGKMLLDSQLETGIELYPNEVLRRWIADAERLLTLKAA